MSKKRLGKKERAKQNQAPITMQAFSDVITNYYSSDTVKSLAYKPNAALPSVILKMQANQYLPGMTSAEQVEWLLTNGFKFKEHRYNCVDNYYGWQPSFSVSVDIEEHKRILKLKAFL